MMGGHSSSQANQTSNTTNNDERVVTESGIVVGKGSNVGNITVDRADIDVVKDAIEQFGEGFSKLLDQSGKMFDAGSTMISNGQATVLSSMQTAENDKKGAIDQKTMIIIGVSAMAAFAYVKGGKK